MYNAIATVQTIQEYTFKSGWSAKKEGLFWVVRDTTGKFVDQHALRTVVFKRYPETSDYHDFHR